MAYLGSKPSNQTPTYKLKSEFVATAGQTVFAPSAYTPGYIDVYRNGVKLGNADFTATNGTTVTLANGASVGDLITFESVYLASIQNGIPATAGAVSTSLIADNAITAAKMAASGAWAPAGTVLQVVNSAYSTQATTSSSTYVDTGLAASITPRIANSKILVLMDVNVFKDTSNTSGGFKLLRNSTDLITLDSFAGYTNSAAGIGVGSLSCNYLDSPSTTSTTSYKIQFKSMNNTGTIYINNNGYGALTSTITLMEISQ